MLIQNTILNSLSEIRSDNTLVVDHCILLMGAYYSSFWNSQPAGYYSNCYISRMPSAGSTLFNCIFRETGQHEQSTYSGCWFGVSPEAAYGVPSTSGTWDHGAITYQPQYSWQLIDPEQKYIGTDGTPVGVHGGLYPWEKIPGIPRILESRVAHYTGADGSLSVTLKAEARPVTE